MEIDFWQGVKDFLESASMDDVVDWLTNFIMKLEKEEKGIIKKKCKKLRKPCSENGEIKLFQEVNERFSEHQTFYLFTKSVREYTTGLLEDVPNVVNLASLSFESVPTPPDTPMKKLSSQSTVVSEDSNRCLLNANNRYIGKFVSDNVVNLSSRNLSKAEISLLSKGLKFVRTPLHVDKIRLKEELETFGRRLRLLWHFRDEEDNNIPINSLRPKSKFNPKGKDAAIEIYLSRLEDCLLYTSPSPRDS